jgi:adenosylmethionine-8-amino-7-oxononanoate aminotransferase
VTPSFDPPFGGYHRHGQNQDPCDASCADEVAHVIDRYGAENVAAVLIEPINGATGGGFVPPPGYLARLREVCHAREVLIIHDEVMVGLGRAGTPLAADLFPGSEPDLSVVSKGLGAGYATLSAVLIHGDVGAWFGQGTSVLPLESTMTGTPLSAAVGLAVLGVLRDLDLQEDAEWFRTAVDSALGGLDRVQDIRGAGYFFGIELSAGALVPVLQAARAEGVVLYPFGPRDADGSGNGFFVAPPLTSTRDELDLMLASLSKAVAGVGFPSAQSR